jgi:NADPH:quinone reductase-like Zn-dependent oxidoreductase
MVDQYKQLNIGLPKNIFSLTKTAHLSNVIAELIVPQGMICTIDDLMTEDAMNALKFKSVGFVWELMFTHSMFKTVDMVKQQILTQIAKLVDSGKIQSTQKTTPEVLSDENLNKTHYLIKSGKSIGKIVLENNFEE